MSKKKNKWQNDFAKDEVHQLLDQAYNKVNEAQNGAFIGFYNDEKGHNVIMHEGELDGYTDFFVKLLDCGLSLEAKDEDVEILAALFEAIEVIARKRNEKSIILATALSDTLKRVMESDAKEEEDDDDDEYVPVDFDIEDCADCESYDECRVAYLRNIDKKRKNVRNIDIE